MIPLLQLVTTFGTLGIRVLLKKAGDSLLADKEDVGLHIAKGTVFFVSEKS